MPSSNDDGFDAWVEPEPVATGALGVDSRLLRIGAIAAVAVLAVPIALALREDGSSDEVRAVPSTVSTTTTVALARPVASLRRTGHGWTGRGADDRAGRRR